MSSSYSANQYDNAFTPQRLQNWCEDKQLEKRPTARRGRSTFIADERGYLLPGVAKKGNTWPNFMGTWDLPPRISTQRINPTGRSVEGLNRLKSWGLDTRRTGTCQPHGGTRGEQTNGDQRGGVPLSSAAEARPASQNLLVTGHEQTASQNQHIQAAAHEPVCSVSLEEQDIKATGKNRRLSQGSAAEEDSNSNGRPEGNVFDKAS